MDRRIHYKVFRDLFQTFGINPYDFWVLVGKDKLSGWYPDLPDRNPKISLDRLIYVIEEGL